MLLEEGRRLFDAGKYTESLVEYAKATMVPEYYCEAKLGIARCFYGIEQFEIAYERFEELINEGLYVNYAKSMQVNIRIHRGDYLEAVKILQSLPITNNNKLRLAIAHYLTFIHDKSKEDIIYAQKALDSIDMNMVDEQYRWRIYLTRGLTHQCMGDYTRAEDCYKTALKGAVNEEVKASILNDYGSLYIKLERFDEAFSLLMEATKFWDGKGVKGEGLNYKWLGLLYKSIKDYDSSRIYFIHASKILDEKGVLKELAEVNLYLADLNKEALNLGGSREKNKAFQQSLDFYHEGMTCYKLSREVKNDEENMLHIPDIDDVTCC